MYKKFHDNINNMSLIIGHLNLLRSSYLNASSANIEDKNYVNSDLAIAKFKHFCKKTVESIEELVSDNNVEVKFDISDLQEVKKIINAINKESSNGIIQQLLQNLHKVDIFTDFLINDFPKKVVNHVDLTAIKTEINIFKYQIHLS